MKRIGKPLMVTAYTTLWGMLFLLPLSLTRDWGAVAHAHIEAVVEHTLPRRDLQQRRILPLELRPQQAEAVKASVWLYLEPVAAFIGSFALFGVVPTPLTILGGAAILIGALLTSLNK